MPGFMLSVALNLLLQVAWPATMDKAHPLKSEAPMSEVHINKLVHREVPTLQVSANHSQLHRGAACHRRSHHRVIPQTVHVHTPRHAFDY